MLVTHCAQVWAGSVHWRLWVWLAATWHSSVLREVFFSLEVLVYSISRATKAASNYMCVYLSVHVPVKPMPSQIQCLPTQCNPVKKVATVNLFPSNQACFWMEFAQMFHMCGKTQAFPFTVQMFLDIVMFVDRKHLDVWLTFHSLFAQMLAVT